jgi:hypothetical protein
MSSWTRAVLFEVVVVGVAMSGPSGPARRGCAASEDVVVEAVLAEQQPVDAAQELAGLRALDDAVVVGARQRDDLADGVAGERLLAAPWNSAGYSIAPTPMIAPCPA